MQYQNQRKPNVRPVRLGMFLLIIILLALIGFTQMEKAREKTGENALGANATTGVTTDATSNLSNLASPANPVNTLSVVLDPVAVAQANIIEYKILSNQKGEVAGASTLGIVVVPTAEWQGDFTKERIAATLLDILNKQNPSKKSITSIYFLPVEVKEELMFSDIALGRLILNPEVPEQSSMDLLTRGYLPEELVYIKLYEALRPKYIENGILDAQAFNEALNEAMGPAGGGMEYPLQTLKQVENADSFLETKSN